MTFRVFEGNVLSLNGWRMCNEDECTWVTVPGTDPPVNLEIRSGIPAIILTHFAARFNEVIEHLRDPDSACWTLTNSVDTSNHPAGIACDFNWNSHPFQTYGTFGGQLPALRQLLDVEFKGCVGWGGDWGGDPQDEMHFEIAFREGYLDDQGNFILDIDPRLIALAAEIQAAQPLSQADTYALACIREGQRLGITPRGIQIALATEMVETDQKIYANTNDPASLAENPDGSDVYPHDAVGSDHLSSGLFQQQPPWGSLADRMDPTRSATLFFTCDNGPGVRGLTKIRDEDGDLYDYNDTSNTPGFYAQKVQGSAFPDRYDARMSDAVAQYNRLVGLTSQPSQGDDDDMAILDQPVQSASPFRAPGEGPRWTPAQMLVSDDGFAHPQYLEWAAERGSSQALTDLKTVAAMDPAADPDRANDILLAQNVLARLQSSLPSSQKDTVPDLSAPAPQAMGIASVAEPPAELTSTPILSVPQAKTETITVRPITQTTIPRSTVVHSIITILGSVMAIAPWVLQSFGDHMSTSVTMVLSGGIAAGSGLLDFLVKTEKQVTPQEKEDASGN